MPNAGKNIAFDPDELKRFKKSRVKRDNKRRMLKK
jgi:hypothetical protein